MLARICGMVGVGRTLRETGGEAATGRVTLRRWLIAAIAQVKRNNSLIGRVIGRAL